VLSHLPHGLCLSFAEGLTPADLLARLTGDLSQAITPTDRWLPPAHERTTEENPIPYAGVARTGVWALAIEPTSSVAAQPDMPATISTGTRALCLRHDRQTGVTRFCYAEDGVLVTEFDPLFPDNTIGADARRFIPWLTEHGLTGPTPSVVPRAMIASYLLAADVFGISLDEHVTTQPDLVAPLTWQPSIPATRASSRRDTPITTPGGLTWWPRPGDPERPIRYRVRPPASASPPRPTQYPPRPTA
jgi:hypothetical protein